MAKIENKQTELAMSFDKDNNPKLGGYFDLIKICINFSEKGFSISDIKERLDLVESMEKGKAKGFITIETEKIRMIKEAVKNFKWTGVHKDVVDFGDYIEKLK